MLVMTAGGNSLSVNITGDLDIAASGQRRHQVELLEHEADFIPSSSGKFVVTHARNFLAINEHLACTGFRHRAKNMHQCGLTAPRWTHNRDQFTFTNSKVHSAKCLDFNFADSVGLTKIGCFEQSSHLLNPKLTISITNTTRRRELRRGPALPPSMTDTVTR